MMRTLWTTAAVLLVGASVFGSDDEKSKKDLAFIQGTWVIAALEVNGMDVPPDKLDGTKLVVKGDEYVVTLRDTVTKCRVKLDATRDPREVDLTFEDGVNKDRVGKGVYRIKGETFQISRGLDPSQDRPREFATWPDTNCFVVTWKKIPDKK